MTEERLPLPRAALGKEAQLHGRSWKGGALGAGAAAGNPCSMSGPRMDVWCQRGPCGVKLAAVTPFCGNYPLGSKTSSLCARPLSFLERREGHLPAPQHLLLLSDVLGEDSATWNTQGFTSGWFELRAGAQDSTFLWAPLANCSTEETSSPSALSPARLQSYILAPWQTGRCCL